MAMRIYLLGFMGSGKSSLGRRLARRLGYDFYDTDQAVEARWGMSVAEMFQREGEAVFRDRERQALLETAGMERVVVATGGGTPCHGDNMAFIRQHGVSVYLRMAESSLAHRLEHARVPRPLVKGLKGPALLQEITRRLAEREPWYLQAHCIIKGETVRPDHVIALVFGEGNP